MIHILNCHTSIAVFDTESMVMVVVCRTCYIYSSDTLVLQCLILTGHQRIARTYAVGRISQI